MRLPDLIMTSTESLRRNTSRSLLTMLGIVIGIGAVILMLSIGQGAQGYILNQVADLGGDQLFVEPGNGASEGGPPSPFIEQTLTLKDVEALRRRGDFDFVSSTLISSMVVSGGEESTFGDIAGVDEYEFDIFPADVASGRSIDGTDVEGGARVVLLGSQIAEDLFGASDPLGERVTFSNVSFRVVGVMAPQGSRFFSNLDNRVYVPVTTLQKDVLGVTYVNFIAVRAQGYTENIKDDIRFILRDTHDINNPENDLGKDDFLVSSQEDAVQAIGVVGFALTMLLAAIASISLVVGGIGIMNIMLVSVTERTREIGLRKAIGATEHEILMQFLLEAVLLTVSGALIGIVFGVGGSLLVGLVATQIIDGWAIIIPPTAIVVSVLVSSVVGIAFGYYPARRAARLDAINALRYE